MYFNITADGAAKVSQTERYKVCKQIRQQQVENYLEFLAREEEHEQSNKKGKKQKGQPERKKQSSGAGRKKNLCFSQDLCLQSTVEELDEKSVLEAMKKGANFNLTTGNGISLLHKASIDGSASMVELLIQGGANVNCTDDDWWTPLHAACYQDNYDVVQVLLKAGANVTLLDVDGNLALDHCIQNSDSWNFMVQHIEHLGITPHDLQRLKAQPKEMCDKDVNLAIKSSTCDTPLYDGVALLHIASANGYLRTSQLLLKNGANVNITDDVGMTPLHCAAKFNQAKMVELLIAHGADIGAKDWRGNRVVDVASSEEIQQILFTASSKQRKAITSVLGSSQNSDDFNDEHEDNSGKRISISKLIYSPHASMSKADKLSEAKMLLEGFSKDCDEDQNDDVDSDGYEHPPDKKEKTKKKARSSGRNDIKEDEEDNIDGYSSSIWKTDNSEAVSLPAKTATDDLADLPLMDEATILTTLIKRYNSQLIYTNINDILVAVNPFTPLPIFGKSVSKQYHNHKHFQSSLTPHVYSVAEHALHAMLHTGLPQCCVIGGESGSGKTETCKHLVQHLLWNTGSGEANLITKLAQMNPLLEAFGNAQTVLNINSSRFAKFLTLSFSSAGKVLGGRMNEFLLEKSRVTNQQDGEMNFHIFYWMLAGITPEEASKCCLQDTKFRYLKSRTHDIQPALTSEFKAKFWEVKESLKFIGFSSEEVTCVLMILSAVLHMGNIIFSTNNNDDDDAVIANDDAVHKVCSLLRISEEDFRLSVVMEAITAKGEHVKKPLTPVQAREGVDSLAKALYSRLFSWIVNGINQMVQVPPEVDASERVIAVLDLFGFENLTENGFEQMCINIANEKLQSFYTQQVFDNELKDCESEGVPCVNVTAPGTQLVIDLFMEKNTGIFDLLDEESTFPKATDASLAAKLHSISGKAYPSVYKFPRYGGASFTVVHYAGMISYNLGGILKTNRDNLRPSLSFLMRGSSSLVVKELFQSQINRTGSIAPSQRQRVSRHLKGAKSPMEFFRKLRLSKKDNQRAKDGKRSETTLKRAKNTLTYHFKNSLTELMTRIQNSKCHFVRCIKPNKDRTPLSACKEYIEVQLQYTGIVETVHIRKQGYALRALYSEFLALYPVLTSLALKEESIQITDSMEATEKILHKYGVRHYQIGTKKVFIQQSSVKYLDELETDALTMIIKMQSLVRRFLAQKKVQSLKTNQLMYAAYLESLAKDIGARQTKLLEAITGLVNQDKENIEAKKNESEESHYINMIDEVLQDYLEPIDFTDLESPRGEDYNYIGVDDVFVDYLKKTNHEEPPSPKDKRNVHPGHLKERKSRPPPPPIPHKPRSSLPSSPPIPSRSPLPPKTSSSSSSSPRPSALPPEPPLSPAPPLPSESNVAKPSSSSSSPRPSAAPPEPPSSPAPPLPSDSNAAKPSSSPRPLASPPEPPSSPVPPLPPGSNAAKLTKPKEQSKLKKEGSQPSTPVDIEEMDPSEFPPSPREMYMYRPGQQVNGHNARSTSPSRGRSAPALPERKPETQLGNRTSLSRSSFSSRGSVSSEVLSPPPSPGYASHSHQDLYQSSTGTPQQIRKHQENKPFSYAVGINPKEAANLHSPREADMRVNKHERDLSPHGGRGNIRSEVSLNNADHQRFIHNEDLYSQQQNDAVIYQRIGGAGRDRLISAPEAGRQGYGQEFDSVANMGHSEGIYGQFVQPAANGGHHRPSLTYVPPPVVPNLQPDPGKMGKTSNRQQQQLQLQQQQLHQQQLQQQQLQQQQLQQQQLQQQQHHQHQQHQLQQEYQHQQNQYQQQQQLLQEQHQIHQHYQEHQHPQHHQQQQQQKAKPSSVPPPPPPPLRISSSLQSPTQQRQPRDLNPTPSGVRSPRSGSPARPAGAVLPHLQRQGSAATMDELAQVKLRTVSDSTTTSPSSPTTTTTTTGEVNSGAINVKLRPTKGKFSNIYAEEETTLPPPPPLDDIDELPPPPPPPELLGMGEDPHAHSLAFTSAPGNPYQSHVPLAPHPQPQPQIQQPHNQFPAGEGNSLQIHHQHQDRQNQHQQQQQHTAPSASSSSSSSFTPSPSCSTTQQVKKDSCGSHTLSGKVNSVPGSGAAAEVEENFTSGIERLIAETVAAMDFEIPDDIDLSQCPGLVEINKSTPNWKRSMIEKKNQEKIEEYVKKILREREQEAKWKNVPEWKRKILQKKDEEDAAAAVAATSKGGKEGKKAPPPPPPKKDDFEVPKPKGDIVPAALSIDPEELAAMPPWKRELLFKRDKVPITFSNEFNPDEEEAAQEENPEAS